MLASTFVVDAFSLFLPLLAMLVILGGRLLFAMPMREGEPWGPPLSKRARRLLVISCIAVFVGGEIGLPFANAAQENDAAAHAKQRIQMLRDLKREHLQVAYLDEYAKTVTLAIGNHGCRLTFGLVKAAAPGWNDFRVLWRPTLKGKTQGNITLHGQDTLSVITRRDLWSLANGSCSS